MIGKIVFILCHDPLRIFSFVCSRFFLFLLSRKKNIKIKGKLILNGLPIMNIQKESMLIIEDGVVLNSRNKGYHINMHSPVKIFADRPGAVILIGEKTRIHGTCIHAYQSIKVGRHCLIAANCQIIDANGHDLSFENVEDRINTTGSSKPVVIEDNVWIGANSIILPGVTVGNGSVIAANSVVVKDIPAMVVAGGNPAKIIKNYSAKIATR